MASGHPGTLYYTAAICQAEILAGIAILPEGRRRRDLADAAQAMFQENFDGKIWPFDTAAAAAYAEIFAGRRRGGRRAEPTDLMIAAIALAHGADIVTRNVEDFAGCGVTVINPWDE
jgi:predicted nucleic acid-binding protein